MMVVTTMMVIRSLGRHNRPNQHHERNNSKQNPTHLHNSPPGNSFWLALFAAYCFDGA